ncbi:exotoxin beta-grasp domain-containing protein, partial [Staphylococcus aureus]
KVLLGMFLSLKTLYRKRTVIWPFYFYTIIRTLSKVTAQELDIKVRTKLNNAYKLYDRMTSDVQKGYIKFHSHSEHKESFYYDLFYIKGNLPDQYLQIYNDNKTIDSSDYHIDVYLFT